MVRRGPAWVRLLAVVVVAAVAAACGPVARSALSDAGGPIADPIPGQPAMSDLALTLQELVTMPRSAGPATDDPRLHRWARINFLGEVPDRSGRLFVPDLNGKLYLIEHGTPLEYLDLAAQFAPDFFATEGLGSGFGFVAFHPDFARNGKLYTVHTEAGPALTTKTPALPAQDRTLVHGVVTEWTAADPAAGSFSGTRREVLRLAFGSYIHGIQQIGFNPSATPGGEDYGLLYIAAGDGGNGMQSEDPQNRGLPQGKILRIDPLGTNGPLGHYGIPSSNPFARTQGALGEIFAYGLRDPYRFSWDPDSPHRMLLGAMGEHSIESIYEVRAGDNLGWSAREGSFVFNQQDRCHLSPLPADDARNGYTYPVAAYDHDPPPGWPCDRDSGHAVIGGFVYRGAAIPPLRGTYVFGDGVTGRVFATSADQMRRGAARLAAISELGLLDATGRRVTMPELAGDARVDLRFGTDAAGELYVLSKANGRIWKVTSAQRIR